MGFEALLGNRRLKENLTTSLRKGRTSHFYLITGPRGSGKHTLATLLAAALMCDGTDRPCQICGPCRKIMNGLHPDFITVEDPEHKYIPVDRIRQVRDEMFIRPNEGNKKIYLLPQAMRVEAQNALLKILEEPPQYGVFILLAENPEALLPTVRSRCVELKLLPLEDDQLRVALTREFPDADDNAIAAAMTRSGGYLGQARELLREDAAVPPQTTQLVQAYCNRDSLLLVQTLTPMEKWKRDQLLPILQQWTELFEGALACRGGMQALSPMSAQLAANRSAMELNAAITALQKAMEYSLGNVSTGAICGWLRWSLR
jgi:DNA polymerase-3 subunit delta'